MPGHVKMKKGSVDPDPTEFLLPSIDMKRADQQKVYDPKKSVWIRCPKTGGFREGLLENDADLEDPGSFFERDSGVRDHLLGLIRGAGG